MARGGRVTEPMRSLKPGDRVRKSDGTTATVTTAPAYYDERTQGYPFTGWAVEIEPDEDPETTHIRIERGIGPYKELVLL